MYPWLTLIYPYASTQYSIVLGWKPGLVARWCIDEELLQPMRVPFLINIAEKRDPNWSVVKVGSLMTWPLRLTYLRPRRYDLALYLLRYE